MPDKTLIIVDGYSLLFRAFYGTRFLSTSDGRPTNALFGFCLMLFNLIERERPDGVLIALDAPGKTFRHTDYAEYKGTRRDTPQELITQLEYSRELISALGITTLEVTGYEADDVVGTISKQAENNGYRTIIVSGDLDALQLVDPFVTVVTPRTGVTDVSTYTPEAVQARYGFGPHLIPDYKALVGDTSDNIPGVPGIGDKSATKLIQEFGTVEKILDQIDSVEEKFRKKIEPNTEQLKKSKWLATIVRDAPVEFHFQPYQLTQDQMDSARRELESLEFKSLAKRADKVLGAYVEGADRTAPIVEDVLQSIEFKAGPEAKSVDDLTSFVAGKPFAMHLASTVAQQSMFEGSEDLAAYVCVAGVVRRAKLEHALELFHRVPEQAMLHDAKAIAKLTGTPGVPRFDTLLAGYVLQSGRSQYALRDLAQAYLDIQAPSTPEQLVASIEALEAPMRSRLDKEGQTSVVDSIELPLVPVLAEMERIGIGLSPNFLMEFSKSLEVTIDQTARTIFDLAGQEFLIASPKQLGDILFEKLGIPSAKKTKTGYATGAEVLQPLALEYPICGEILTWRELTKLKSTYADALPRMVAADGRIHTTFNQTVAATGRLSSIDPNLQNIPIRTELGRQIRKAFVAAPGFELVSCDYSQIELRLLAHYCHDDALVEAFRKRVDVHTVTASLTFGISQDQVTKEQRRLAKMLNYAVLYGVTDFGLAQQLGEGFSVAEAKALIAQYFERFPKVKAFTVQVIEEARSKGFTSTLCGRRRYFPDIHAANRAERLYAERQAINAPLQGTAADMIKLAMIRVRKTLGSQAARMLLQVHDELVFEVPPKEVDVIEPICKDMEGALPIDVPIEVDAKVGPNWGEMSAVSRSG